MFGSKIKLLATEDGLWLVRASDGFLLMVVDLAVESLDCLSALLSANKDWCDFYSSWSGGEGFEVFLRTGL